MSSFWFWRVLDEVSSSNMSANQSRGFLLDIAAEEMGVAPAVIADDDDDDGDIFASMA